MNKLEIAIYGLLIGFVLGLQFYEWVLIRWKLGKKLNSPVNGNTAEDWYCLEQKALLLKC